MNSKILAAIVWIFILGWVCGSFYSEAVNPVITADLENPMVIPNQDLKSPNDWIKENQIHVYDDKVVIDIDKPLWAKFAPTKSMDPVFDEGSNAIQIAPEKPEDIHPGDIISYESSYAGGLIIHRVMRTGHDENGWYAIARGDNNNLDDPYKIRFDSVKKVLVAIIY